MAQKRQRAFALVAAIVFLISTVAFTGMVILTMAQENNTNTSQEDVTMDDLNTNQTDSNRKLDNFEPLGEVTQLQKIDLKEGSGEAVNPGATVTVHYTGALAKDGTVFESSKDTGQTATFGLDQVIKGWTDGIPGMKVGGTRRLIIPAELAYGEQSPSPRIPANSALVFDVELVDVK